TLFDPAAFAPYEEFLRQILKRGTPPDLSSLRAYPALAELLLPKSSTPDSIMHVFVRGNMDERETRERAIHAADQALHDVPGATLTGMSVLAHNTESAIARDLPKLALIAIAMVALYLLLHFRRPIDMLLALLPMLFGLITLLAVMRLLDQHLNMVNLVALPLLIGIDVDYGIFIVHLSRKGATLAPAF